MNTSDPSGDPPEKDGPPFLVEKAEAGRTVSDVLRGRLGGIPWSQVRALCTQGRVLLDNQPATDPALRVRRGQSIELSTRSHAPKAATRIELLHVDRDVVVVNKPADLLSVPFDGEQDTLVHLTSAALRRKEGRASPPLRVVQRLDKDTTGVLVFARNKSSERALGQQFRVHSVERRYLGIALGELRRSATHDTQLVSDRGDGLRGTAGACGKGKGKPTADARRAITHIEPLEVFEVPPQGVRAFAGGEDPPSGIALRVTLVSCRLETGRQHQIRIHLAEAGHPLVGERVYCREYRGPTIAGFAGGDGRPLLHAETLGFIHPSTEAPLQFECDPPADFSGLLGRLARS